MKFRYKAHTIRRKRFDPRAWLNRKIYEGMRVDYAALEIALSSYYELHKVKEQYRMSVKETPCTHP